MTILSYGTSKSCFRRSGLIVLFTAVIALLSSTVAIIDLIRLPWCWWRFPSLLTTSAVTFSATPISSVAAAASSLLGLGAAIALYRESSAVLRWMLTYFLCQSVVYIAYGMTALALWHYGGTPGQVSVDNITTKVTLPSANVGGLLVVIALISIHSLPMLLLMLAAGRVKNCCEKPRAVSP